MPKRRTKLVRGIAPHQLKRAADAIRILGHPDRLRIVEVLEEGPHAVTELQDELGLDQAIVSQHLARLRGYGIVESNREGARVYYEIIEPKVRHILECIRKCDL